MLPIRWTLPSTNWKVSGGPESIYVYQFFGDSLSELPLRGGEKKDDKESHAAALRYVDSQLPRLFEAFRRRSDTLVIALSDHGTCYGEDGYEYHCISHEKVYTVPYKHFILRK